MNALVVLSLILLVLMYIVGNKQGLRAFFALFLNFVVLLIAIAFWVNPEVNMFLVGLLTFVAIGMVNLFFINGVNEKTKAAFIALMIVVSLLVLFIRMITSQAMIQGFGEEEVEELAPFSLYVGLDFVEIVAIIMIMSAVGAMMDVAISISTSMYELYKRNQKMTNRELFQSGMTIGRDILGTDTNTLFFAFFGGYLALLIWFKDLSYSFGEILNSKVFSAEMMTIFSAGVGIACIIPLTSIIMVYYIQRMRKKGL